MLLKDYIKSHNLTREAFADMAGLTRQTIYNIMCKNHTPSFTTVGKIEKATNGWVSIEDFYVKQIKKKI